ncbi:hypothetical protein [Saccharothrix sp. ALI-22-I]|uniref:hypothetical protein n=1 Tax=Saccharothrix sp. ALI-22-I TaxID=1933778 RepID=UPI00117B3E1B|nr:hypothetical protein [Saccharothrix sp. ALI-22-I]
MSHDRPLPSPTADATPETRYGTLLGVAAAIGSLLDERTGGHRRADVERLVLLPAPAPARAVELVRGWQTELAHARRKPKLPGLDDLLRMFEEVTTNLTQHPLPPGVSLAAGRVAATMNTTRHTVL